jgi:quercetin dioxygenase-like cupin family protein
VHHGFQVNSTEARVFNFVTPAGFEQLILDVGTRASGVWIVLADKAQTSGNITNIESIYQHGGGLPRLFHEREAEMAYVISGRLRIRIGDEPETTAGPGAMVFVPRGVARRFTADVDDTRVYHGFVPAGFEQLIVEHAAKTESMTVPIGEAPFDPATAMTFGIHVVSE